MTDAPVSLERFGAAVGISKQAVSELVSKGVLVDGQGGNAWLLAYCDRLREMAAGRYSEGPLDLTQERAALAREQRDAVAIKNALARGEFAPIGLLAQVLASASMAVAERFEHLDGLLTKTCPDMSQEQRALVLATIATARNEWVKQTAELVAVQLIDADEGDDEPSAD